jgi:hypothetical protein
VNADAARRYKEISGLNTESVERMREFDRALVEELEKRLAEAERLLNEASERERSTSMTVDMHWEVAMKQLWDEHWLTMKPKPAPVQPAPEMDSLQCDAEVENTATELREALRKPSMLPRRGGKAEPRD